MTPPGNGPTDLLLSGERLQPRLEGGQKEGGKSNVGSVLTRSGREDDFLGSLREPERENLKKGESRIKRTKLVDFLKRVPGITLRKTKCIK